MADDRNRRDEFDDYSGADPGRERDLNEESVPPGRDEIRGIADEGNDEFEDTEDLEEDDEGDEY